MSAPNHPRFAERVLVRATTSVATAILGLSLPSSAVWAGGVKVDKVASGRASVESSGAQTIIRAADKSIINYRQFDVAKGESVRFIQPGETARVLNRITGGMPSKIDGSIQANGKVYLVNPSGIVFGRDASVKANSFVAAAANLSDQNFLAGIDRFSGSGGVLQSHGAIEAGSVTLLGSHVKNTGSIVAANGAIAMVAGDDVYLTRRGDNVMVKVSGGKPGVEAAITHSGKAKAKSGIVFASGDMYSLAIDSSGMLKAPEIEISASQGKNAVVAVSGTVDATNPTGVGGNVTITGDYIAMDQVKIDASGSTGGGKVLVGGDWQGTGTTPHAKGVYAGANSTIHADALDQGDGGKVVLWSDDVTRFRGQITAKGGAASGNGGMVETSGGFLDATGKVNTLAGKGEAGQWLLDPFDIEIRIKDLDNSKGIGSNAGERDTYDFDGDGKPDNVDGAGEPNITGDAATYFDFIRGNPQVGIDEFNESTRTLFVATGDKNDTDVVEQPAEAGGNFVYKNVEGRSVLLTSTIVEALNAGNVTIRTGTEKAKKGQKLDDLKGRIFLFDPIIYTGDQDRTLSFEANGSININSTIKSTDAKLNLTFHAGLAFYDRAKQSYRSYILDYAQDDFFQRNLNVLFGPDGAIYGFTGEEFEKNGRRTIFDAPIRVWKDLNGSQKVNRAEDPRDRAFSIVTNGGNVEIIARGFGQQIVNENPFDHFNNTAYFGRTLYDIPLLTKGGDVTMRLAAGAALGRIDTTGGDPGEGNIDVFVGNTSGRNTRQVLQTSPLPVSLKAGGNLSLSAINVYLATKEISAGGDIEVTARGSRGDGSDGNIVIGSATGVLLANLEEGESKTNVVTPGGTYKDYKDDKGNPLTLTPAVTQKVFVDPGESYLATRNNESARVSLDGQVVVPKPANGAWEFIPPKLVLDSGAITENTVRIDLSTIPTTGNGRRLAEFTGSREVNLSSGGSITFNNDVRLLPKFGFNIRSSGGGPEPAVWFKKGVDGSGNLRIAAPNGAVRVSGALGSVEVISSDYQRQSVALQSAAILANRVELAGAYVAESLTVNAPVGQFVLIGESPKFVVQQPATSNNNVFAFAHEPIDESSGSEPIFANSAFANSDVIPAEISGYDVRLTQPIVIGQIRLPDLVRNKQLSDLLPFQGDQIAVTYSVNAAEAIAGAVPQESRKLEVGTQVSSDTVNQLADVGVIVREPLPTELANASRSYGIYDDFPYVVGGSTSDYRIVNRRLPVPIADRVIDLAKRAARRGDVNGSDQRAAITAELSKAMEEYKAANNGELDPQGLRRHVESKPEYAALAADLQRYQELLDYIPLLGLSPAEAEQARRSTLSPLVPADQNVDAQFIRAMVEREPVAAR